MVGLAILACVGVGAVLLKSVGCSSGDDDRWDSSSDDFGASGNWNNISSDSRLGDSSRSLSQPLLRNSDDQAEGSEHQSGAVPGVEVRNNKK